MQGKFHYHSVLTSIRGTVIFNTDADRLLFLNILRRFTDKHNIAIVEFVLMDNHIHILHTGGSFNQANKFVGELQQNFSFWYNRFHSTKDKLFNPAKVSQKCTPEQMLQTTLHILQRPMAISPGQYRRPGDYKWSSWHYHYNFMLKSPRLVAKAYDVHRANRMFDAINSSRSSLTNKCPLLKLGFQWPYVKLSDIIPVDTYYIDRLYTPKVFKILVQEGVFSNF